MAATIVKVNPLNPEEKVCVEAARVLRNGGLVVIPTETVYGIAADSSNRKAVDRLMAIKGRPGDKPFSLHITDKEEIDAFVSEIPVAAYKLMDRFWPGPLTLVFKSVAAGTIGVRMPDDKTAFKVIRLSGVPIICPSSNLAGQPAPSIFSQAIRDVEAFVDYAIDAGPTRLGVESTVVDVTKQPVAVLREGAIKKSAVNCVVQKKIIVFVCTGNSCRSVMAQGLLKKRLQEQKRNDVEVLSAGIMSTNGLGASYETRELLARQGIDVSGHRSQRATTQMLNKADIIMVMERMQEERLISLYPQLKNRVFLLKEFAKVTDFELDIPDPIGRSKEFYAQTFAVIDDAVDKISKLI